MPLLKTIDRTLVTLVDATACITWSPQSAENFRTKHYNSSFTNMYS